MRIKIGLLLFIGVLSQMIGFGQCDGPHRKLVNFESNQPNNGVEVYIDTSNGKKNQWQIGIPNNLVIDSAFSGKRVIMTDTSGPYYGKDTSSFIIKYPDPYALYGYRVFCITGAYWSNSDSLKSFGEIAISRKGKDWINAIGPNSSHGISWDTDKPVLSGKTNGWVKFAFTASHFLAWLPGEPIWIRFTFYGDTNSTGKDGLAFDEIELSTDLAANVIQYQNEFSTSTYPNPAQNQISFEIQEFNQENFQLKVYNSAGKLVKEQKEINAENPNVSVEDMPNGIYFYQIFSKELNKHSTGKFIIQR